MFNFLFRSGRITVAAIALALFAIVASVNNCNAQTQSWLEINGQRGQAGPFAIGDTIVLDLYVEWNTVDSIVIYDGGCFYYDSGIFDFIEPTQAFPSTSFGDSVICGDTYGGCDSVFTIFPWASDTLGPAPRYGRGGVFWQNLANGGWAPLESGAPASSDIHMASWTFRVIGCAELGTPKSRFDFGCGSYPAILSVDHVVGAACGLQGGKSWSPEWGHYRNATPECGPYPSSNIWRRIDTHFVTGLDVDVESACVGFYDGGDLYRERIRPTVEEPQRHGRNYDQEFERWNPALQFGRANVRNVPWSMVKAAYRD